MKPCWKDAPPWANWLARDTNGEWWWYSDQPCFDGDAWIFEGQADRARYTGAPNDSLEPRPIEPR